MQSFAEIEFQIRELQEKKYSLREKENAIEKNEIMSDYGITTDDLPAESQPRISALKIVKNKAWQ
jgi:hypothetical protein